MKKTLAALVALLASATCASAQGMTFYPAQNFTVIGKGFTDTETPLERLPVRLKGVTRDRVWYLGKNTSGLAIRFRTASKTIGARWELYENTVMNHMAFVGIKGLDLYSLADGKWQFVCTGRPAGKTTTAKIIENLSGEEREYLLYLPLYDGVLSLEIGVDSAATITKPNSPALQPGSPIVFYGTSITQGGCASRPGMAYPSILSRWLNREVVNLGFSGNGRLDYEIAEAMATIPAACYVIDCVPNVTADEIREKAARFVDIIRKAKPTTPIIMIENPLFPHTRFDTKLTTYVQDKNAEFRQVYEQRRRAGDRHITYIEAKNLIGHDQEATVDGIHLTDLGFMRLAETVYPVFRRVLKQ